MYVVGFRLRYCEIYTLKTEDQSLIFLVKMSKLQEIVTSNCVPILISLLTIFALLLYNYLRKTFKRDPRHVKFAETLPGPPCLPLIGNGFDFYYGGKHAMKKLMEYSVNYGEVYRLWFGKHLTVGLTKAEDLEDVFMNSKMLGKPELFRPFQDFWGDGLFTGPMHVWKKNRKRFQPIFGNNIMGLYTPEFNDKIYATVNTMKQLVNGLEFDAWDYLPYLSFDVITKTSLNVELDPHDKSVLKFHECVKIGMETSFLKMFRPWLHIKWIRDLFYKKQVEEVRGSMMQFSKQTVRDKMDEIKQDIIHRKNINQSPDEVISLKSFLTTAYELQEEANNETLMHDEIITMITGGTDTTAITNSFFVLAIAIHQDIQNKLYDEIFEVFGDSDRYADHDDIKRLPYLDQVLKETLRRFTLVPVIFRDVEEDGKIGHRVFPAGTTLAISLIGVHFNPDYYPNPFEFNPENFNPELVEKRHKLTFLPFSVGARNCIGQNYAMLEMKLTLIALLRHFSFHTTVKMEDVKMNMGFLTTSPDGYKISIKHRIKKPSYLQ
ncbi:cytochrome P450 4C1-like [Planococcus citri]|uniref:cytochrome P450 4C1-like n=1 Tax=Planococcus citri TaxID=170843 RepID=UPI0031F9C529